MGKPPQQQAPLEPPEAASIAWIVRLEKASEMTKKRMFFLEEKFGDNVKIESRLCDP